MRQFRVLYTLSLVASVLLLGACQKEDNPSGEQYKQFVQIGGDIESIETGSVINLETGGEEQADDLRMALENNVEAGVNKGVRFDFAEGERINVTLFFKQGNVRAVSQSIVEVGVNAQGKYTLNKTDIGVPSTIVLSRGGVTVTGAIGVMNGRVEAGKFLADVVRPGQFMKKQTYVVPMYFPETAIQEGAPGHYNFFATFRFYGAIVGVPVENPYTTKFTVREMEATTPYFTTEGTMDLTAAAGDTAPVWKTTQTDGGKKIFELTTADGGYSVPAKAGGKNGQRWYFFWVKPKSGAINANSKMTLALKSFTTTDKPAYLDEGLPELTADVQVKKALKETLVHRTPKLVVSNPPGELIITEVFRGAREYNIAIELYNSSDQPVNLNDYQMHSFDPIGDGGSANGHYYSDLLQVPLRNSSVRRTDGRCVVLFDRKRGTNYADKIGAPDLSSVDITNHYILPPKKTALFVEQSVKYTKAITGGHESLYYVFNIGTPNYRGFHPWAQGGYIELIRKPKTAAEARNPQVVDVFLKFNDIQHQDTPSDVWSYTMMRKPDRNTPRKSMEQGRNSDWVGRDRTEDIDWGHRFGYTQVGAGNAGILWFDGTNYQNGYAQTRPMHHLSTDPAHAGFLRKWQIEPNSLYTLPTWWQKPPRGNAH